MKEQSARIADLIVKHWTNELDDTERQELDAWLQQSEEHRTFINNLTDDEYLLAELAEDEKNEQLILEKVRQRMLVENSGRAEVVTMRRLSWLRVAAAAAVIFSALIVFWIFQKNNKTEVANVNLHDKLVKTDIGPGGNKAILTLGSGQIIDLANATNGSLAFEGKTEVVKKANGELSYDSEKNKSHIAYYNTLLTPKGGQYQVTLPDGSRVWLNAASSLRYPTAFVGNERVVELSGEAYFEIAKEHIPFIVKLKNDLKVQVLGTHFNVNDYIFFENSRITLLEGSVKVTKSEHEVIIKPGEQAAVRKNNNSISINHNVDREQVLAWKNGNFYLDNENLESIMKQLELWYDVEVKYASSIPDKQFGGEISRNKNLSEVLKALELSDMHFRIEGRKIIVVK